MLFDTGDQWPSLVLEVRSGEIVEILQNWLLDGWLLDLPGLLCFKLLAVVCALDIQDSIDEFQDDESYEL